MYLDKLMYFSLCCCNNSSFYIFLTHLYVGNGRIGLPVVGNEQLYIFYKRSLSVPISYHPIVQVDIPGASSQGIFFLIVKFLNKLTAKLFYMHQILYVLVQSHLHDQTCF